MASYAIWSTAVVSDAEGTFLRAQQAFRAGHKHEARALLQDALRADPTNHRAWLWLAAVTPSPQASLDYIARAERLHPGDPAIPEARAWAEQRLAEATAARQAPVAAPATPEPVPARTAATASAAGHRFRPLFVGFALLALLLLSAVFLWLRQGESAPRQQERDRVVAPEPTGTRLAYAHHFSPRRLVENQSPTPVPSATPALVQAVAAKPLLSGAEGTARPTWTVTPSPTPTATPTPTILPTFVSNNTAPQPVLRPAGVGPGERWIDVNLTTQTLVAYEGNVAVYQSLVSSGTWNHPTVTGQFRVWLRFRSQTMDGRRLGYDYYLEDVPYVMYFYEDYALHGTFWHNNFGTPMSHGCVNLPTPVAEWIFNWSELGTLVNVHY